MPIKVNVSIDHIDHLQMDVSSSIATIAGQIGDAMMQEMKGEYIRQIQMAFIIAAYRKYGRIPPPMLWGPNVN